MTTFMGAKLIQLYFCANKSGQNTGLQIRKLLEIPTMDVEGNHILYILYIYEEYTLVNFPFNEKTSY